MTSPGAVLYLLPDDVCPAILYPIDFLQTTQALRILRGEYKLEGYREVHPQQKIDKSSFPRCVFKRILYSVNFLSSSECKIMQCISSYQTYDGNKKLFRFLKNTFNCYTVTVT